MTSQQGGESSYPSADEDKTVVRKKINDKEYNGTCDVTAAELHYRQACEINRSSSHDLRGSSAGDDIVCVYMI